MESVLFIEIPYHTVCLCALKEEAEGKFCPRLISFTPILYLIASPPRLLELSKEHAHPAVQHSANHMNHKYAKRVCLPGYTIVSGSERISNAKQEQTWRKPNL